MSKGPIHIPPSPLSSEEALAQLREKDVVDVEFASRDIARRSGDQMALVSGATQSPPPLPGARRPPIAPRPPAPPLRSIVPKLPESAPSLDLGIEEIEPEPIEDLEITPNLANRRSDTLPEWMRPDFGEPVRELASVPSRPSLTGRMLGVAALALVAAGAWWFAADGFGSLQAGSSVVAASPAVAAAPQGPPQTPPSLAPVVAPAKADPVAGAQIQAVQAPVAKTAEPDGRRATRRARAKSRAPRVKKRLAPAAKKKAVASSISSVQGLMVGAAGSGRSCRSVGNTIAASDHERVNLCFKIRPAKGMRKVVVQWRRNGKLIHSSEHGLPISPGPHAIRAFSRVESGQSGAWTVQLRDASGQLLGSKRFKVGM